MHVPPLTPRNSKGVGRVTDTFSKSEIMLSRIIILVIGVFLLINVQAQNVGINATGASPDDAAILDVSSSDKGVLIPRTDTASINAAVTPVTGSVSYTHLTLPTTSRV